MKGLELKHRISSIKETVKITKAMQLVSASKMYKAEQVHALSCEFMQGIATSIKKILSCDAHNHPYIKGHKGNRSGIIVLSSDKGLCGDFNHVLMKNVEDNIKNKNIGKIFTVGHMAREYFLKKGIEVDHSYGYITQEPHSFDAETIANDMLKLYDSAEFDEIYIIYTSTPVLSKQEVICKKLIPIELDYEKTDNSNLLILPNDNESMTSLLSLYIMAEIYHALCDNSLAVNYKRMVAMQQSTTNGEEIVQNLITEFNHKRQESITTELMDASSSEQGRQL